MALNTSIAGFPPQRAHNLKYNKTKRGNDSKGKNINYVVTLNLDSEVS